MTLSKVKQVQSTGSFENDYGTLQDNGKKLLFKFEYVFEDGVVMTANHKTTVSPFPEGSVVEYEVKNTHPEHGKSGKVSKPDTGNYTRSGASSGKPMDNDVQSMIVRQSSLTRAIETLSLNKSLSLDPVEVIELAGRYSKWVMQTEAKPQPEKVQEAVQNSTIGEENQPSASGEAENDLPF